MKYGNDKLVFTSRVCINKDLSSEVQKGVLNLASPQLNQWTTKTKIGISITGQPPAKNHLRLAERHAPQIKQQHQCHSLKKV